jgi:hypothetical protein
MTRYDQRLEKLEQRTNPQGSLRIVFVNHGETEDEAAARAGADNTTTTMFVRWLTPDQSRLSESAA